MSFPDVIKVLKQYQRGPYVVRHEKIRPSPGGPLMVMKWAYTPDGKSIGDPKDAAFLHKKYGIEQFEKLRKSSEVCSIGWSPTKQLWYGWSHRAIKGFRSKGAAKKFAEGVS